MVLSFFEGSAGQACSFSNQESIRGSPTCVCDAWLTGRQPLYNAGNETPVLVVGIIAAVLLAAGLLPPYGEIYKRRGRVVGINWVRGIPTQMLEADWG